MDKIQEKYSTQAIKYHNMYMYFIKDAISVISFCKVQGIPIHGVEAFMLSGRGIQPSSEHSLWFKDIKMSNWEEVIDFLKRKENEEYLYELWYEGYE